MVSIQGINSNVYARPTLNTNFAQSCATTANYQQNETSTTKKVAITAAVGLAIAASALCLLKGRGKKVFTKKIHIRNYRLPDNTIPLVQKTKIRGRYVVDSMYKAGAEHPLFTVSSKGLGLSCTLKRFDDKGRLIAKSTGVLVEPGKYGDAGFDSIYTLKNITRYKYDEAGKLVDKVTKNIDDFIDRVVKFPDVFNGTGIFK